MRLELSLQEAQLLLEQLSRHISELKNELMRTDKRQMQRAMARDVAQLTTIEFRLAALLESQASAA